MKLEKRCSLIVAFGIIGLAVPFGNAFALDAATYVGVETCVACHSEKGESFKNSPHGKKIPLVKKIEFTKTCETCHGPGSLHAAAAGDKSNPGFATIKNPAKMAGDALAETCFTCHKQKEVMQWNTGTHSAKGLTCAKCHSVHDGHGPKNLKLSPTDTCLQCHKSKKMDINLPSHHPIIEGKMTCVDCHNPHGGANGNLKAETVNETCFKCHAEKAGPFANEHPPVTENCTICHKPHGSANQQMLKYPMPYLCITCHKMEHAVTGSSKVIDLIKRNCFDCHKDIHGSESSKAWGH